MFRAFLLKRIQVALPDGCYGRIAPRSGLAYKKGIDVGAGVVDQDYRGNVGVILFNFGEEEFKVDSRFFFPFYLYFQVEKGDRIAQFILERIWMPVLVESAEKLEETVRGEAGFGSTGVKNMKMDNDAENRQPLVENKL